MMRRYGLTGSPRFSCACLQRPHAATRTDARLTSSSGPRPDRAYTTTRVKMRRWHQPRHRCILNEAPIERFTGLVVVGPRHVSHR